MKLSHFCIETDRLKLCGLRNEVTEGAPIIALHGWLDNAASFEALASELEFDRPFYALELPGHGHSDHRSKDASYHLVENLVDLSAFIKTVIGEHKQVSLIGHSMGGIICCLFAASSPDLVKDLVLLDSLGPLTDETENVLPQLRKAVDRATRFTSSKLVTYPDLASAALVRTKGVGRIGIEAAQALVTRGMVEDQDGWVWRSDSRLMEPSFVRFSEAQVEAIFRGIECPVKLIVGDKGYFTDFKALEGRFNYIPHMEREKAPGGHHFHMEEGAAACARSVEQFYQG